MGIGIEYRDLNILQTRGVSDFDFDRVISAYVHFHLVF